MIKFKKTVDGIIEAVHEIRARKNIEDLSQFIKVLTEGSFKDFQKHGMNILSLNIKNRIMCT